VAIVTGGAGAGIGSGITEALARRGWAVVMVDMDETRISAVRDALSAEGMEADGLVLDITAHHAPEIAVEHALRMYGHLDGLVNNAGIGLCKPAGEVSDDEFERLFDVDFRSAFRFCRAALPPLLASNGAIVNIGSVHAHRTISGYALYAGIKSAIEAFTRGIAADYGRHNVRANCIHPGLVMSPQNRDLIGRFAADTDVWIASYTATKQLLPDLVTPSQVGALAAFLLGPESAGITGQAITIDCGSSAMLYGREPSPGIR
jgi:NAD(P)-dependent dehydrogenase (short-subunit alcohol dehydrogenase family)